MLRLLGRVLLVGFVIAAWPLEARAEVTFLGPTPYLSVADSPFDMSGLGTSFFFEDFEDGSFDLPLGATTSSGYAVLSPDPITDSVDADDGVIDGSGNSGHSLRPPVITLNPTNPPTWLQSLVLSFDFNVLGFSPNALGFVWTDGAAETEPFFANYLTCIVYQEDGGIDFVNWNAANFLDSSDMGETAEDRFIGVRTTGTIARVQISMSQVGDTFIEQFEIDHIQFGYFVPEPVCYPRVPAIVSVVAAARRRGRKSGAGLLQ